MKSKHEFFFQNLPKLNNGGLTFFSNLTLPNIKWENYNIHPFYSLFLIIFFIFFCLGSGVRGLTSGWADDRTDSSNTKSSSDYEADSFCV